MVSSAKSSGSFGTRLVMLSPQSLFIFDLAKMDQIIDEIQQIFERNAVPRDEPKDTEEIYVRPEDRLDMITADNEGSLLHKFNLSEIEGYKVFIEYDEGKDVF